MSEKEFFAVLEEALGAAPGTVTMDKRLADIPEWDSLGSLSVIALLDENHGISLGPGVFEQCKTVADLAGVVDLREA